MANQSLRTKQGDDFFKKLCLRMASVEDSQEALYYDYQLTEALNVASPDLTLIQSLVSALRNILFVDLTDWTIGCSLSWGGEHVIDMTTSLETDRGFFKISMTEEQTELLSPQTYDCDIQFTDADGILQTTVTFDFVVDEKVRS